VSSLLLLLAWSLLLFLLGAAHEAVKGLLADWLKVRVRVFLRVLRYRCRRLQRWFDQSLEARGSPIIGPRTENHCGLLSPAQLRLAALNNRILRIPRSDS
jgi:hypothetical protein